jgi:hypothetical protein
MRRIRRTALVGVVWLTAAAVAVAGTPHLICACPAGNKHEKAPACEHCRRAGQADPAKSHAKGGGCCCCCQVSTGKKTEPKQPARDFPGKAEVGKAGLNPAPCVKTLAQPDALALPAAHASTLNDLSLPPLLISAQGIPGFLAENGPPLAFGEVSRTPPPTDLLSVCCRLLI